MASPALFIGIMSGTSLDGVDAILADFSADRPQVLAFCSDPFPTPLRRELLALNAPGNDEIERSQLAAVQLADCYAIAVASLLKSRGRDAGDISAIGCHGQTIRHRPDLGFTVQLNHPARLAESTGINVVADFRSRDIAAGGQGAPLVPAFHDGVFRSPDESRVVVNIGGIANLTMLAPVGGIPAWGFDCGPGNCLMDAWIERHQQRGYDADGRWAASGQCLPDLLDRLLADPYFPLAPPKSSGRELFNMLWLDRQLQGNEAPEDVQATLLALTCAVIIDDIQRHAPAAIRLLVCGGGAQNSALMAQLATRFSRGTIESTDAHGVPAQQVEALAFAWLARKAILHESIDLRATTGARHPVPLGALYLA